MQIKPLVHVKFYKEEKYVGLDTDTVKISRGPIQTDPSFGRRPLSFLQST